MTPNAQILPEAWRRDEILKPLARGMDVVVTFSGALIGAYHPGDPRLALETDYEKWPGRVHITP